MLPCKGGDFTPLEGRKISDGVYFLPLFLLFIVDVLQEGEDGEDPGCESRFRESQRLL
jgi:hypothetical protein